MKRYKRVLLKLCLLFVFTTVSSSIPELMPAQIVEAAVKAPTLKETKKTLYLGGASYTVKVNNLVKDAKITYASSNKKIATVSKSGKITPVAEGKVTITVTVKQNNKTYTLKETITVKKKVLTASQLYEKCGPATVEIQVENTESKESALGSGFFITENTIVTNYHVISGANKIQVITNDEKTYEVVSIEGYSEALDLAVLKIKSSGHTYLQPYSGKISVGDKVYALGSPRGLTGTMSDGIISTVSRVVDGIDYVQTTAPISNGNSGGPLLNEYGEVVGVNTFVIKDSQNLNFAINIKELEKLDTSKPVSVENYYKEYQESRIATLFKGRMQEDPVKSQSDSDQQVVPDYTLLSGTVTAAEKSDFYRITVTKEGWFYGIIYLESREDMKNAYLGIYDKSGRRLANCYENASYNSVYTIAYIKPGDYYIGVYLPDGYTGSDLPYNFIWTQY